MNKINEHNNNSHISAPALVIPTRKKLKKRVLKKTSSFKEAEKPIKWFLEKLKYNKI